MKEQLISFETANLAKEKGFANNIEDSVESFYINGMLTHEMWVYNSNQTEITSNRIAAPTQSLLQKWLREVHKIDICINLWYTTSGDVAGFLVDVYGRLEKYSKCRYSGEKPSYEKALEKGLFEALKLIK